ncbi:MAG: thiamine pyrophosphate-binding protein [Candidatus Binatia bacterium]
MTVADYVARFLAARGVEHVFAVSGGASLHLIHAIARTPGITYVCPQHEQAGAMAADAYARITGLGAAIATSGPGATNMITGACGAYYDSVPVIYVTGQVSTFRLRRGSGVRQLGFQETDVVAMFRPVTKYAVQLEEAAAIRYELEKAHHLATTGRPGPVLLDIPDDLQRAEIDPDALGGFAPEAAAPARSRELREQVAETLRLVARAERPVLILGWGVRLAAAEALARDVVEALGIPVLRTWAALDLLPANHPLAVGAFGTHGTRAGNFTVQNADLVVAIGARLDTRATGGLASFAREAAKVVVDIDPHELAKLDALTPPTLRIAADAGDFLAELAVQAAAAPRRSRATWLARVAGWAARHPICPPAYWAEDGVNPYAFVQALAAASAEGDTIVVDTGCAVAWTCQAFAPKPGQRLLHDFNNTAMGWALPASIGASLALGGRPVTCVTGDGSLQMNLQELATVLRHRLPVRIFLLNNGGYSMIRQTQDQWLGSDYLASTVEGGLAFPDFERLAAAYGYPVVTIARNRDLHASIRQVLDADGPVFCNVVIDAAQRVAPQVKWGRPIEDGEPLLERREFLANMIVRPDPASLPVAEPAAPQRPHGGAPAAAPA